MLSYPLEPHQKGMCTLNTSEIEKHVLLQPPEQIMFREVVAMAIGYLHTVKVNVIVLM